MLEFMKLGFAQIAFGGEGGGGGGGSDNAPTSSPRPTQRPDRPASAPAPRDDGPSDADRNRQALLESQMQQEQRGRATQEAAAVAADRQRQASAQAEANRQAQEARQTADRQRQQQEAARRMEEQQRQEDRSRVSVFQDNDPVFQGPTLTGPGYTLDPTITVNTDPDTGFITSETISAPTGILNTSQAADQLAGIQAQQQAYQDMLARAQAAEQARRPVLPTTPVPRDFVPSQDLRDERGSLLPPTRDLAGVTSVGYDIGQIDPPLARAAGVQEGQPAFGQTTGRSTIESLYGLENMEDITPSLDNLADLTLATNDFAGTRQILGNRPDLMLAPPSQQTVVATGQVPAGTPGTAPQDMYMSNEVQTLIESSPQARQVYDALGLTPFSAGTVSFTLGSGTESSPTPITNYRDQQGNVYSQAEALDRLRAAGAQTTTLPGGYTAIAPLDITAPTLPALDLGLTPVDVATPVTVVSAPGGGPRGGPGRGDPRDFGFSAEEAAAAAQRTAAPAGLEGLLDRSPTLGQPASTTVPQAADIIMPGTDTSPSVEVEVPTPLVAPGGETAPEVDLSVPPPEVVGGEPDAAEDVEVTVDTGPEDNLGEKTEGYGYDMNGDERVSIFEILTDMTNGGGPGQSGDEFEGGGILSDIGNALGGPGGGTGGGAGDGDGDGSGSDEDRQPDVEVEISDEDAELPVEEEEPAFECPPGFRRVQMANGGFTCVPEMVRPRVGPYTQPVSVAPLAGRTPFRPGTRRT